MAIPANRRKSRSGVTLVEVMLAGAMTAIAALATLEGFIVAAKIAHENAETLRADGIAFDLLWRKFYGDYEAMTSTVGRNLTEKNTADKLPTNPYYSSEHTNTNYPSFSYTESVSNAYNGKILSVDLKYGANDRYTRHLEVFRSEIPRTN